VSDESSFTGETRDVKKTAIGAANGEHDAFVYSGTYIMTGSGRALVLAVGTTSQFGVLQMALRDSLTTDDVDDSDDDDSSSGDGGDDHKVDRARQRRAKPPPKWPHNKRWVSDIVFLLLNTHTHTFTVLFTEIQ
jgi:magnesium-transporting ATPase (P-type)